MIREDDILRLKTKEDGSMNSSMLQNPSDPEVTYREKAGKQALDTRNSTYKIPFLNLKSFM